MDAYRWSADPAYKHVSLENSSRPLARIAHKKRNGQSQPNNRGEN